MSVPRRHSRASNGPWRGRSGGLEAPGDGIPIVSPQGRGGNGFGAGELAARGRVPNRQLSRVHRFVDSIIGVTHRGGWGAHCDDGATGGNGRSCFSSTSVLSENSENSDNTCTYFSFSRY